MKKYYVIPEYLRDNYMTDRGKIFEYMDNNMRLKQLDVPDHAEITIDEQAKALGLVKFDTAMPQPWVTQFHLLTGENPCGHFVWCYDGGSVFGKPTPISRKGEILLKVYQHLSSR